MRRVGRVDREPDDVATRKFLLQRLHVAARVVLAHERALGVRPFEHDVLALVAAELHRLPDVSVIVNAGAGAPDTTAKAAAAANIVMSASAGEPNRRRMVVSFGLKNTAGGNVWQAATRSPAPRASCFAAAPRATEAAPCPGDTARTPARRFVPAPRAPR